METLQETAPARARCRNYTELEYEFDPASGTIWGWMKQRGNPCFNLGLLKDIRAFGGELTANGGHVEFEGAMHKASYYVAGSRVPRVFNLGGDLALFLLLIRSRDREALAHYGRLCIDNIHARAQNYFCPTLTTISLVQGDALGGGFEHALSSDLIVAERRAKFGLPEILFGLFPGMGAYSFLARRLGAKDAERMILSGRIYSAEELHAAGVVDVLAEDGSGEIALEDYIRVNYRHYAAQRSIYRIRRRFSPLTYAEMEDIAELWVGTALTLSDYDLRKMRRLSSAQTKRHVAPAARAGEALAKEQSRGEGA